MHRLDLNKGKSAITLTRPDLQNLEFIRSTQNEKGFSNLSRHNKAKRFAIYLLGNQIIHQLKILQGSIFFENECTPIDAVVSQCFSWSFEDFLERRKENNLLELLILSRIPADCLEKKKSYHDLKQVLKLIVTILEPYLNDEKLEQAMEILQDRLDYNGVYSVLDNELNANWRTFYRASRDSIAAAQFRVKIPKELLSGSLDQEVYYPVQQRYTTNYGKMQVESAQIKYGKSERAKEQQLKYYEQMIINEQKVHQNIMLCYDVETYNHQANIAKWDAMYDEEFDIHLSKNEHLKKLIEQIRTNRISLNILMIEHREALAALRIAEEEERLRKIQYLRQIEEEEAEAKRLAKQKLRENKKAKLKEMKERIESASLRSLANKKPIEKLETEKPKDVMSQVKKPAVRKSEQRKSNGKTPLENKLDVTEPQVEKSQESNLNVRISQEKKLSMNKFQEEKLDIKKSQEEKLDLKKSLEENLDIKKSQEYRLETQIPGTVSTKEKRKSSFGRKSTTVRHSTSVRKSTTAKASATHPKSQEETLDIKKSQEEKLDLKKSLEENLDIKKSQEEKLDLKKSQEEKLDLKKSLEENLDIKKSQEEKLDLKKSQEENLDLKKSQEEKLDLKKSLEENLDIKKTQEYRSETQISEIVSATEKTKSSFVRKSTTRHSTSARRSTTARTSASPRKSATGRKSATPIKSAQRKSDFEKSKTKGQNLSSEISESQNLEKHNTDFTGQIQENQVSEINGLEKHDLENQDTETDALKNTDLEKQNLEN